MPPILNAKRPTNLKGTAKQFLHYLGKHKILLFIVAILVTLSALGNLLGTYMFRYVIGVAENPTTYARLWQYILIEVAIYLVGALSTLGYTQIMVYLAQKVIYELRRDMFSKMETLPLSFFDHQTHGQIMSNYTNDIDMLADAMNNAFAMLISNFIQIVGLFVLIFILNWLLSILCTIFYIIIFAYVIYASKKAKRNFEKQQEAMAKLNGFVEESLSGQKVVKVFNHEEENILEFTKQNKFLQEVGENALRYSFSMIPFVVSVSYINYAVVAIIGGLLVIHPLLGITFAAADMATYLVFVRQATMPINQFTQQANLLLGGLAGAERIFKLINEKPEIDNGNVTLVNVKENNGTLIEVNEKTNKWAWKNTDDTLIPLKGDVRFYDVDFSYYKDKPILTNLSLYAKPGQKIAFVGSTGAGKTTITNLINRFYEIDNGSITYDGIDIKNIRKRDLRHSLGIVLQDTHLFTGTIKDNIKYGKLDATDDEVVAAAKLANADSFIRKLPNGYNTYIVGDGANLSQGQRQLLSIARAMIADLPVLILDEATSSIDTRTEALVEKGMDKLMEGRTVFMIAHRLSTIKNSNAIMVLEHGKIIERGTHKELLAQKGIYYALYTGKLELD